MSLWFSRIVSALLLVIMTGQFRISVRTVMDPGLSFNNSLVDGVTPIMAVVNAVLLPFVVFLIYFANWGRLGWHVRAAALATFASGLGALAYVVASLSVRYPMPGNYMDVGLVFDAFFTAFLWFGVAFGVLLRWRHIRPNKWDGRLKCEGCDYDLTGNVSGTCPECGKAIPMPYNTLT